MLCGELEGAGSPMLCGVQLRCCGGAQRGGGVGQPSAAGAGAAGTGGVCAAASLWAGEWDKAGGGSGSAGSPLCRAGMGDKQRCGNKAFNMHGGEQQ